VTALLEQLIGKTETISPVDIRAEKFDCFICEVAIRPSDKALVIHLKNLPPLLRKKTFFVYACQFFKDRIGAFREFDAGYLDKLDDANEYYSLDMFFIDNYPALMGDMDFLRKHVFKIAHELNKELVDKIGDHAARENARRAGIIC